MHPITILFTGDFCPHQRIEQLSANKQYDKIFNNFINVFQDNDLNITDIECPITISNERIPKTGPYQLAAPHTIEILKYAGINVAAMANNHIMDCGSAGAIDTINACKEKWIATIGIGYNDAHARTAFSASVKDKKIAILNFAENEFIVSPDRKLKANSLDLVNNYRDIQAAKQTHDYVFLMMHGGNEFYNLPSPRLKETCRFFVDAGVDAVMCYHTHCHTGYEVYRGKPVFYGLGNFIYDWPGRTNSDWNKGYAVKLKLTDIVDFEIIPFTQGNEVPGIFHLNENERNEFFKNIKKLNIIIADDKKLSDAFDNYCNSVKRMYEAFIEPNFGNTIASLRARGLFPKLMKGKKRLLLLNIARCEAHRDVLLNLLSKN